MNKSTITREQLRALAVKKIESLKFAITQSAFTNIRRGLEEELQLAEFALAALDSEPVAWTDEEELRDVSRVGFGEMFSVEPITPDADMCRVIPLYRHAQPAPVVDADDNFYSWFGREWHENYQHNQYTTAAKQMLGVMAESAWKAGHRAAMLQAEPVTTANKLPETQFKQVADLYEMQFDDGRTCAFHTDAEKAVQWLNTCDGNKVQEYVKLERLHDAVSANSPVIPDCSAAILRRWLAFGCGMKNIGIQLPRNLLAETEVMLAATMQEVSRG